MAILGTKTEYEAMIVDSLLQRTIAVLPWQRIEWQRTRCNVSEGRVTVAGIDGGLSACRGVFGRLRPWGMMLRIERNGAPVWDGPIIGWGRPELGQAKPGDVTVRARDRAVLTQKRLIGLDRVGAHPAGETMLHLIQNADIGDPAADPWPMTIPPTAPDYLTTFDREYRVARLERVYDALDELCRNAGCFYTQHLDRLLLDEEAVAAALGVRSQRPKLSERTVVASPDIDFDALDMVSVAYVGASAEGESGFPIIGSSNFWSGEYLSGRLESGYPDARSKSLEDAQAVALLRATEGATGVLAVEQMQLAPQFGGRKMTRSLSNLLPGVRLDVDFQDTCAFDVPFIDIRYETRTITSGGSPVTGPVLTPVIAERVSEVRLDQLDVSVEMTSEGLVETVLASCSPTAEWDGTLPAGWRDPTTEDA